MCRCKIMAFLLLVLFALGTGLSAVQTDSLYVMLHKQAVSNLKNMPPNIKCDYERLLNKHPDRVMAFLLGYEENGRLAATNPLIIESHYYSVADLMREQGITQPDEFFLSYVAKCTVSDEAITDYRSRFEEQPVKDSSFAFTGLGLKELRQRVKDPLELYRQMCLKSTELLMYKPTSGRDESPLEVAEKSLYGRCEESQILFVALCRTVGIPARPASTPWWAHQDDNHAWAEVYLDGAWHYSGDSDGGYWPDQTWFSGLANKMVVIVADGTLPAKDDEVLSQDEFGASINSIKYYAGDYTRTLKLKVVDINGKAVAKCPIAIDVYNFFSLRPQTYIQTDDKGEKTITVGMGAFFLMAVKDSLIAIQFVPSETSKELTYTLTLNSTKLPEIQAIMEYPSNHANFKDAPQSWKDDVKLAKDKWQNRIDEAGTISSNLSLEQDSLLIQVIKKCRLNYQAFWDFAISSAELLPWDLYSERLLDLYDYRQQWLSLLLENDEKDLWQADSRLFMYMYVWFIRNYPRVTMLPRAEMQNLFDPTVLYESLPWMSYRGFNEKQTDIYPGSMVIKKTLKPSPQQVITFFRKKHAIKTEKAMAGLIPMDLALSQKNLMGYQYKILACNYLRANLIPANYTRIPYVVSVFVDSTWKYFDLSKNDFYEMEQSNEEKSRTMSFSFTDELNQPVALSPEQVQICFLKEGQFFPTNEQPDYKGNGVFEAKVPVKGMFYTQIGYRNSDSLTVYYLKPLTSDGKPVENINMQLDFYHRKWLLAEDFLKPIMAELDKQGLGYAILGNYSRENTIRMAAKLKAAGKNFVVIGSAEGKAQDFDYQVYPVFLDLVKQVPSLQNRTITLVRNDQDNSWQMYEGLWDSLP